jgi:hypothetical protein
VRIALLAIVSAGLLFGASKSELDLKAKLAAANAQLATAAKDKATLTEALTTAAVAQAQLAAAIRDKAQIKASLDALAQRDQASQQNALKVASQAASQAAAQAASQGAAKNRAELSKALAAVDANSKQQAAAATEQRIQADAATDANADQAKQAVVDAQAANAQAVLAAIAARTQVDELKIATDHSNLLIYVGALGGVLTFLTLLVKVFTDIRAASATAAETRDHRALELSKIAEVKNAADASYREANTVNQKIEHIGLKMKDGEPLKPEAKEAEKA